MTFLNDNRFVGWCAALLLGLTPLLPWVTIWGQDTSTSVLGYELPDGMFALALALLLALFSSFNRRLPIGVIAAMAVALYTYEMIHFATYEVTKHSVLAEQLPATAYQIRPGLGLLLGGTVSLLLLWWSVYRWVESKWVRASNRERVMSA